MCVVWPFIIFKVSYWQDGIQVLQFDYTVGPEIHRDPYHVSVVRTSLTRNFGARFSGIQDEITTAFAEHIPAKNAEH
jgi:hypothetical protein